MNKEEARREVVRRWREQPVMSRQTHEQAGVFAASIAQSFDFHTVANRQRLIQAWLVRDIEDREAAVRALDGRFETAKSSLGASGRPLHD